MAKQLAARGIPDEVADRLESLSRARGQSVNSTVNDILSSALGVQQKLRRLDKFVTWTDDDLAQMNEAVAADRMGSAYEAAWTEWRTDDEADVRDTAAGDVLSEAPPQVDAPDR